MPSPDYVCSLSGVEADEDDILDDATDDLGAMPVGWTRVTFQRRLMNPRWEEVEQGKELLIETALAQVPEESKDAARLLIALQIDAQFVALEAATDRYVVYDEVIYVAPPELDKALATEFFSIRERLGLPVPSDEDGNREA
jgi:hypothetical protein